MPVEITKYYYSRPDRSTTANVVVCDATPYVMYQTYVDLFLAWESSSPDWTMEIPPNKRVDILGLDEYEGGGNYTDWLTDIYGDKAELFVPYWMLGIKLRFYWDGGTGIIDYTKAIFDIDTTGLPVSWRWGQECNEYDDQFDEFARIVFTGRLQTGTYKFGVVSYNVAGCDSAPLEWAQVILTRPDEIYPKIVSYDPSSDVLVVSTVDDVEDWGDWSALDWFNFTSVEWGRLSSGVFNVYAGQWNQGACSIDFTTPIEMAVSSPFDIVGLRGSRTAGTLLLAVRETRDGIEEKNFHLITFTVAKSDSTVNQPANPTNISGYFTECNSVFLTWQYDPDSSPAPDGFNIYSSGVSWDFLSSLDWETLTAEGWETLESGDAVEFTNLVATIPYHHKVNAFAIVGSFDDTTAFTVRAYIGDEYGIVESQNTDLVVVTPAPSPAVPCGNANETWRDIGDYSA